MNENSDINLASKFMDPSLYLEDLAILNPLN